MEGFRSGNADSTAFTISLFAPGTAWDTPKAMLRYSFGTARQTAFTIAPAWDGASAAAALAMALACFGCSAAAVPAATEAISGTARAMAPTIAGAAAGLMPSAAFTTFTVVACRSRVLAWETRSAALDGNSAAGTAVITLSNGFALGASFAKELQATRKAAPSKMVMIRFIGLS